MASLSFNIQDYLRQQESVTNLVGFSKTFSSWIWADRPFAKIEGSGKDYPDRSALVVITESGGWTSANEHNTLRFPRVYVDVWADPTRHPDGTVKQYDADIKIERIHREIMKYLHLVDTADSEGRPICWGSAQKIADRTGSIINQSTKTQDPDYRDIAGGDGGRMGTVTYNIAVA